MKLEKAHSTDLKKDITSNEADAQFSKGAISSKFDFQCPDKNCCAQVTCANLGRPKHLRKREPYYKVVGEHSEDCLIAKDIKTQSVRKQSCDIYSSKDQPIEGVYRLNLQPPSTKKTTHEDDLDEQLTSSNINPSNRQNNNTNRKTQSTKTLSSIVDSFLNNESIDIQLPKIGSINIQDLFVEINGQEISDFLDEWRIYYCKAWFNKRDNGYSVQFNKELTAGQITKKPSFYISNISLQNSGFVKFNQQNIQEIANNIPKQVFIMSEIAPYLKDNRFINIWCEAPHFMDYRL